MERSCLLEIFLSNYLVNQQRLTVQGYGLSGNGVYCHIWEPEINPWDLQGGRRDAAPASFPLSTHRRWPKHTHKETHTTKILCCMWSGWSWWTRPQWQHAWQNFKGLRILTAVEDRGPKYPWQSKRSVESSLEPERWMLGSTSCTGTSSQRIQLRSALAWNCQTWSQSQTLLTASIFLSQTDRQNESKACLRLRMGLSGRTLA